MLEHGLLAERAVLLALQQAHQVGEEAMVVNGFADDQFALVNVGVESLAP